MTSGEAFLSYSGGILNNCLTILHINENETDINEHNVILKIAKSTGVIMLVFIFLMN